MLLNFLLAFLFAVGLFVLVVGTQWTRPVALSNVERLHGQTPTPTGWLATLQRRLDAARFNVTAGLFVQVAVLLALVTGIIVWLLTGALVPALLSMGMAIASYWLYLSHKASKASEAYEEQLPQVVSRLVVGARMGSTLRGAAEHAAQFGPPICRDDWVYICRQMDAGADLEFILRVVSARRNSQLLDSIFELLLIQHQRGTPISDMLPLIQQSLAERTKTVRAARTRLGGPLRELYIVCGAPIFVVILLRFMSPQFAAMYASFLGQLLVSVVWLLDVLLFIWLYRSFSANLRKLTNFYGDIRPAPRTPLEETRPTVDPEWGRRYGFSAAEPISESTPSSLGRYLGPRAMPPASKDS